MFSQDITETDYFTSMPEGARLLYFVFGMLADDYGFLANPEGIIRQQAIARDNYNILIIKKFIIPFESGVIVIRHWHMNNYIRPERRTDTHYQEELSQLVLINKEYKLIDVEISRDEIPDSQAPDAPEIFDVQMSDTGKVRLSKVRLGQVKNPTINQTPTHELPTYEQVETYCKEKGYTFNCQKFYQTYAKFGWQYRDGKKIDWRQQADYWNQTEYPKRKPEPQPEPNPEKDSYADEVHQQFMKAMGLK